jgi:hypothetical protein
MAAQYDRATPEEGNVAQRHGLLPLATYDNGRTGLAFPGFVAEPVQSFNRLLENGYTPGDTQGVEDAFNVAGAAMLGGFAAPKPAGVVGSAGGSLKGGAALGAIPDTPGIRAYRGVMTDAPNYGERKEMFASSNPRVADDYASLDGNFDYGAMLPLDMRFKNPMQVDAKGERWTSIPFDGGTTTTEHLARKARDSGHDGLIVNNVVDAHSARGDIPATTYAALQRGTVYSPLTGELLFANGGRPGAATGAALGAIPDTPGIRAWHASPYEFDKPNTSKMGSGEGFQAFGNGFYTAESPAVSGKDGAYYNQFKNSHGSAHAYELNIKADPSDFLNWDAPLSQQSDKVKRAIESYASKDRRTDWGTWEDSQPVSYYLPAANARAIDMGYALKDQGVAGISYFDQGSRVAGEGSRNHVVFPDADGGYSLIEILRKYGLLGMAGGAAAAEYGLGAPQSRPASPQYRPGDA